MLFYLPPEERHITNKRKQTETGTKKNQNPLVEQTCVLKRKKTISGHKREGGKW